MGACIGRARPRVGLLGNPSDIYQGRVLGFTFDDFAAEVRIEPLEPAQRDVVADLTGPGGERAMIGSVRACEPQVLSGGCQLFAAALRRLALHAGEALDFAARPLRLTSTSNIPRQAGLSGSSALITAALRALSEWYAVPLDPFTLSELTLAAEVEELGATAGPQDRVLQAYEGLLYMDFQEPRKDAQYARLDPALLPPLFLLWNPEPGEDSGAVHSTVRERWLAGDAAVRAGIALFPTLAAEGLARLRAGDHAALADLLDAAFEARAALFDIAGSDRAMRAFAHELGAGATTSGSGGAVVCIPRDAIDRAEWERRVAASPYEGIWPRVTGLAPA